MSSNPYVVRTDELFGFLQKSDLKPQSMAVEQLKYDRMCSRRIQELHIQYLKILSEPNDTDKRARILDQIQQIQNLKTKFNDTKFISDRKLYDSSKELEKKLLAVGNRDFRMLREDFRNRPAVDNTAEAVRARDAFAEYRARR
jgi:hypothetical protein